MNAASSLPAISASLIAEPSPQLDPLERDAGQPLKNGYIRNVIAAEDAC